MQRALRPFFARLTSDVLRNLRRARTAAPALGEIYQPGLYGEAFNRAMIPEWNRALWTGIAAEASWIRDAEINQRVRAAGAVYQAVPAGAEEPHPSIFVNPSEQMLALARKFLEERAVGVWVKVGKTTGDMIRGVIVDGIAKGWTFDEMQAQLGKALENYAGWQNRRVARTETTGAVNFGGQIERDEVGITHKGWVARIDVRTRTLENSGKFDHLKANGKIVENKALFTVSGEKLLYPGDGQHGASAGNLINCRCSAVAELDPKGKKPSEAEPDEEPTPEPEPAPKKRNPKPAVKPVAAPDAPVDAPAAPAPASDPATPPAAPQKRKRKPRRKPEPAETPQGADFPDDPNELRVVTRLGGSTGAELVEDAAGRRFVRKRGASPDHLREEYAAEEAYRAVGARVPRSRLYENGGRPVKLSEYIEGKPLSALQGAARERAIFRMEEHYAADALLGNWDVAGASLDNVLVDRDGNPWRIDTGASLRFRAQGSPKGEAWNEWPEEFWTLADRADGSASKMYGRTGFLRRMESLRGLSGTLDDAETSRRFFDALPADVRETVRKRLDNLRDTLKHGDVFLADNWTEAHVSGVMRHRMGMRREGIFDLIATELKQKGQAVKVKDKAGREFDHLRGTDGVGPKLADYLRRNGGDYGVYTHWSRQQGGSSWSEGSKAFKVWLSERHPVAAKDAFWHSGAKEQGDSLLKATYAKISKPKYDETMTAMHAFNYSLLQHVQFKTNNIGKGFVTLMRTEPEQVMRRYGIDVSVGRRGVLMQRGMAESFSVYKPVYVAGRVLTVQDVPHTRVFGTYWLGRNGAGYNQTPFYGDSENEFVCLAGDIPFWIKSIR